MYACMSTTSLFLLYIIYIDGGAFLQRFRDFTSQQRPGPRWTIHYLHNLQRSSINTLVYFRKINKYSSKKKPSHNFQSPVLPSERLNLFLFDLSPPLLASSKPLTVFGSSQHCLAPGLRVSSRYPSEFLSASKELNYLPAYALWISTPELTNTIHVPAPTPIHSELFQKWH